MADVTVPVISESGFDASLFQRLYAVEDRHFWFRSRNRVIATLVSQITAGLQPGYRVLEVGCGTGNVLRVLQENCHQGTVIGIEPFAEALPFARQRVSCEIIQGDLEQLPNLASFDLVCLFDVLEHISDDSDALRRIMMLLNPGGVLLLTVPAHRSLWSYFDDVAHHYRRYEEDELRHLLVYQGFDLEYLTPFQSLTFLPVWLGRKFSSFNRKREAGAEEKYQMALRELRVVPVLHDFLYLLSGVENTWLQRRWRVPIGSSLLALARKPT